MRGRVINKGCGPPHQCYPPGWLARLYRNLIEGAEWECKCGQRWYLRREPLREIGEGLFWRKLEGSL